MFPPIPASFKEQLGKQFAEIQRFVLEEVERLENINASLRKNNLLCSGEEFSTAKSKKSKPRKSTKSDADDTPPCSVLRPKSKAAKWSKKAKEAAMNDSAEESPVPPPAFPPMELNERANERSPVSEKIRFAEKPSISEKIKSIANSITIGKPYASIPENATQTRPAHSSKALPSGVLPDEPVVVASCPEDMHDEVMDICEQRSLAKAYGRKGDMVDTLAGDDWVGKWEAKVVLCAVTKAKAMHANRVKIICIQGGPHCDKEMAAQPRLKKAIKQEFGDEGFRVGVEWLEIEEFREKYGLRGSTLAAKVFLCCRKSNGLETVLNLKSELEMLLPTATFWLDLEDVGSDQHMQEVKRSTHFLLFLTQGATSDAHVQLQVQYAIQYKKSIIIVMETERKNGVSDLSTLLEDANEDIKPLFVNNLAIPWSNDSNAQQACLEKISSMICADGMDKDGVAPQKSVELVFGANGEVVLDPLFLKFCSFAAFQLPGSSSKVKIWTFIVDSYLVFLSAWKISWLLGRDLENSLEFRDYRDHIFHIMWPLLILFVPRSANGVFRTKEFMDMITRYARDISMARHVRVITRKSAMVLIVFVLLAQLFLAAFLVASWQYYRDHFPYFVAGAVVTAVLVPRICSCFVLVHVIYSVVLIDFASSFHDLHPQIKNLGIKESVENGIIVHVRDSDFVRFQTTINGSTRRANFVFGRLSRSFTAVFASWMVNFAMQIFYSGQLAKFGSYNYNNEKYPLTWATTCMPFLMDAAILFPLAYAREVQLKTRMWAQRLIFTKFSSRIASVSIAHEVEVYARLGPRRLHASFQPYLVALVCCRLVLWFLELSFIDLN